MSGKRYIFRGDNGWNDLLSVKKDQKITIIPEPFDGAGASIGAPAPLNVPATENATDGWDTQIDVSTNQIVELVAEGKWQGEAKGEWAHTFQFDKATGNNPDTTYDNDVPFEAGPQGQFVSTKGWESTTANSTHATFCSKSEDYTYRVTKVVMTYDMVWGGGSGFYGGQLISLRNDSTEVDSASRTDITSTQSGITLTWEDEDGLSIDEIYVGGYPNQGGMLAGDLMILSLHVEGIGINPFKEWTHTFDFTQERNNTPEVTYGQGDWYARTEFSKTWSTYVSGQGWESKWAEAGSNDYWGKTSIEFEVEGGFVARSIEVTYDKYTNDALPWAGSFSHGDHIKLLDPWFTLIAVGDPIEPANQNGTDFKLEWTGEQYIADQRELVAEIWYRRRFNVDDNNDGSSLIKQITIRGIGYNPFDKTAGGSLVGPEGEPGTSAPGTYKLQNEPKYALLYQVGTGGTWTKVGNSTSFTPSADGRLYLAMNDDDYTDNARSLQVYVEVAGRADGSCDDPDTRIDATKPAAALLYRIPQVSATGIEITSQQVEFTAGADGDLEITRNACDAAHYAVRVMVEAPAEPVNQNQDCGDCDEGVNAAGQPCSDNPIQLKDGTKVQSFTDLVINAPNRPLTFVRRYNQANINNTDYEFMGAGWSHNHRYELTLLTSPDRAEVLLPDGGTLKLTKNGATYEADSGSSAELAASGSEYELTLPNRSKLVFNSSDQLVRREWPNGDTWSYTYTSGDLTKVADDYGNELTFAYYSGETGVNAFKNGQLKTLTDSASRTITLDYVTEKLNGNPVDPDGAGPLEPRALLSTVTDVRGEDWSYDYYGQSSGQTVSALQSFLIKRQSPQVDAGTADGVIDLEELGYTLSGSTLTDINQKRGDGLLETDFAFQPNSVNITEQVFAKGNTNFELVTTHHFANGVYVGALNPFGIMMTQALDGTHYRSTDTLGWQRSDHSDELVGGWSPDDRHHRCGGQPDDLYLRQ